MPTLEFEFNLDKNIWNIWNTVNSNCQFMDFKSKLNPILIKIAYEKDLEDCKEELKNYYSKINDSQLIPIFLDSVSKAWKLIEKDYFKRLAEITNKPISSKKFKAYITTIQRCPYNTEENWFMINFFSPITHALRTIGHELMHLQFIYYYKEDLLKEISNEKFENLKEALTELLNIEFKDLWIVEDNGYEMHKELREFIKEEWKKNNNFDSLIKKCVEHIK